MQFDERTASMITFDSCQSCLNHLSSQPFAHFYRNVLVLMFRIKATFTSSGTKNIRFVGGAKREVMVSLNSMVLYPLAHVLCSSICL